MSIVEYAREYCTAEVMAAFLSRDLKDEERGGTGAVSMIPWLAARMAQATHAPGLWLFGFGGMVNPKIDRLQLDLASYNKYARAEANVVHDIMDLQGTSKYIDFMFYGGFQVDKYGNINMAYIGEQSHPKFRGPGSVGVMGTALVKRVYIFVERHDPRLFVDKVDFISGPGFLNGGRDAREKSGIPSYSKGPRYIVTPICIFDFEEETKHVRLKSLHPGHTIEEVKNRTGFTPIIPANVPETEPPTIEEHEIMMKLDPDGILPRLVP